MPADQDQSFDDIDPEEVFRADEKITREWLPMYISSLLPKKHFSVSFDLARTIDVNACAKKTDDGYRIVVNRGLIIGILKDLFEIYETDDAFRLFMLHHPDNEDTLAGRFGTLLGIKDAVLVYAVLHELGHIVHGHLDWLAETKGVRQLNQVGRGPALDPLTYQTLEFDADLFAVRYGTAHYPYSRPADSLRAFSRPEVLGIAMALLFNLLADETAAPEGYDDGSHPAPEVRLACMLNVLGGLSGLPHDLAGFTEQDQKNWTESCFAALIAQSAVGRCRLQSATVLEEDGLQFVIDPHIDRFLAVLENYKALMPNMASHWLTNAW